MINKCFALQRIGCSADECQTEREKKTTIKLHFSILRNGIAMMMAKRANGNRIKHYFMYILAFATLGFCRVVVFMQIHSQIELVRKYQFN